VAGLTAFYMFRLYFLVFWGNSKTYSHEPHESPAIMLVPMIVLAIGSMVAGFIPFGKFISSDNQQLVSHIDWPIAIASVTLAFVGIGIAWKFYKVQSDAPEKLAKSLGAFYTSALSKFYFDELYLIITKGVIFKWISQPISWFDRNVIDAFMNLVAAITNWISEQIKEFQSGQLQKYAFIFISGVIIIVLSFIYANQ